jgi:hypothetical protein
MDKGLFSALLGAVIVTTASAANAQTITTGSLIEEMIDLHRLAEFPDPAFQTVQFSSYDHRSTVPGGPDWFANSDGFGNEPVPNFEEILVEPGEDGVGEYLICDVNGPGAIVRCWTAAIAGHIRMYLDDTDEPVFDGTADDFLRRPYNVFARQVGIDESIFDGSFNQRNAAYCPIPFAKRCRIVWIGKVKEIHFYEVQVRLYEPDAKLETFSPDDLRTFAEDIERIAPVLAGASAHWEYATPEREAVAIDATVPAGERQELLTHADGACAIERLTLRLHAGDLDHALRQTILFITCDDWPQAQVQSPLGDFFGAAPGVNPFDSVPFTVGEDGTMTCRFIMPFQKTISIAVDNRGDQPVTIDGSALVMPYEWNDNRSMHFRARWRVDHDLIADPKAVRDLPFLIANGTGLYVGTTSIMLNPTDVPTPAGGWWGEGDEKIFVDDDVHPSTFGTGSEDYYNYAWSSPDIFGFAYCGQPRNDGPGNRGFVTNQRWHVIDSLPFRERLAFYMELYSHKRTPGYSYARLAYHYARPGLMDDYVPITDEDVRPLSLAPNWQPLAWWGAGNSTFHDPETLLVDVSGETDITFRDDNLYASGRLMVWQPQQPGETITFRVPVGETGNYVADLCAAKTDRSGSFRWMLAGEDEPGKALDDRGDVNLHAPGPPKLRRIGTRPLELAAGTYLLTLEFTGAPGEEIGIDFIWLQKR